VTIVIIVLQHNTILTINLLSDRVNYYGYCMSDLPTFEELYETEDDQLFNKTVYNSYHTLQPPPSIASQHYNLRHCTHCT